MEHYSLYELNEYIRRTIALNFDDPVWISAEIAQINFSSRHVYLELWEKNEDSDSVIAQSSAVIWADKLSAMKKKAGKLFDQIMQQGVKVLVKVVPEFHERYGLKLVVQDLDPSFTLGKLAMQKEVTLDKLAKEGLLQANYAVARNRIFEKIAVLSSETSAGYQDFLEQLRSNPYEYEFNIDFRHITVQGDSVRLSLTEAMSGIIENEIDYDCVIVLRGGGSKMDLAAFDDYYVAKSIASCPYPVITGIGHERDTSVSDQVAAINLKTPTAVADFLIEMRTHFEAEIIDLLQTIQRRTLSTIKSEEQFIHQIESNVLGSTLRRLEFEKIKQSDKESTLIRSIERYIEQKKIILDRIEIKIDASNPQMLLQKGYSITKQKGRIIKSVYEIDEKTVLETVFADGTVNSKILENG